MSRAILFLRSSRQCTGLERRMVLIADAAQRAGFHPHVAAFGRDSKHSGALHPLIACATEAGLAGECIPDPSPFSLVSLAQSASSDRPAAAGHHSLQ